MSVLTLNVDEVMRTLSAESSNPFVVHDKEVDIVRFAINSGFADIVLDGQVALRVMYQRPGETEVRAQTLTYYDTDGIRNYYGWELLAADLAKKGTLNCALCILRTDAEVEEWHTTPCQIRVLNTIHTDDSDEADETITPTVAQRVAVLETMIQRVASGAPIVVSSASAMTDTDQIYVLSTDREWYYYNGTAWVAGGEYGAVSTDTTLTQSGIPADAKAVGDAISAVDSDLYSTSEMLGEHIQSTDVTEALDVTSNGLTLQKTLDGKVKIYGTATAVRNYGFLNGQFFVVTSTYNPSDTLDAGTYIIEHGISGTQSEYLIRGTYDTFANGFKIASAAVKSPIVVTFDQPVTIAFSSTIDRNYGTEEAPSYMWFNASKLVAKDAYARDSIVSINEDLDDINDDLLRMQSSIERIRNYKTSEYDFTDVDTSGYTINGVGKWASSNIAKSHIIKIPKGTYSISVTANSEQTAIIAFLNSFAPAVGAQADFSDGYSERIVIEAGASAEYEIDDGMVYVYVLIADTSSNDHTPSLSLTYPANLPLPINSNDNDRSGEISVLLNAFGVCELEKGTYIIGSSIKMHASSKLVGSGSTIIMSDAVTDGSAVIMNSNCIITGVAINGGLTSAPSSEGTRNGIEWTGDTLLTSFVDKCVITGFSGSGIFLHDTTTKTYRNLLVINCRIMNNFVGIDFRRNTEFNRVSNCTIVANRYGIRNRGGNNHVGNCGLDANYVGIQIDMDEGDNTGHGGISNCTINHSNHNNGYGIIIKDTGRMIINNCNLYYSKIKLENTNGNIINGCGFGNSTGWEIDGGECSMFVNCMIASAAQTPITITNNTAAKVVNCFARDGSEVVIAGGAA